MGYNNIMSLILWLMVVLLADVSGDTLINFDGFIMMKDNDSPVQYYSYNISSDARILTAIFDINNLQYSNTFIYLSFSPIEINFTSSDISLLLQANSPSLVYMNPLAAIGGISQIVNVYIPTNKTIFYLKIFNLDGPQLITAKFYSIQIYLSASTYYCLNCPYGTTSTRDSSAPLSCQCSPCGTNMIGPSCAYNLQRLSSSTTVSVNNNLNKYFYIAYTGSTIHFTVRQHTNTSSVYLYVQYQFNSKMIAGKLNSYYKDQNTSYQFLLSNQETKISVPSLGFNVLLTLQNYARNTSTVSITIPSKQESSIIPIVIAVCLSVVGLILVLSVGYKIKKKCSQNAVMNVNAGAIINHSNLSNKQINRYFPEVLVSNVFTVDANSSMSHVNINNEATNQLILQCSICFDTIARQDSIRVTYCKHIFHSKCLLSWFHKNPSCPNCRQHYDTQTTTNFRQNIRKVGRMKPNQLIKAILGVDFLQKHNKQKIIIEQKMNENEVQQKVVNIPQQSIN